MINSHVHKECLPITDIYYSFSDILPLLSHFLPLHSEAVPRDSDILPLLTYWVFPSHFSRKTIHLDRNAIQSTTKVFMGLLTDIEKVTAPFLRSFPAMIALTIRPHLSYKIIFANYSLSLMPSQLSPRHYHSVQLKSRSPTPGKSRPRS